MKEIQKTFAMASIFMLMVAAISLSGCKKEEVLHTTGDPSALPGKYKRNVTLQDGGSAVTFEIGADDPLRVAAFVEYARLETSMEATPDAVPLVDAAEQATDTAPIDAGEENTLHIRIASKALAPGVKRFSLRFEVPQDVETGKTAAWVFPRIYTGDLTFHSVTFPHVFDLTSHSNGLQHMRTYKTNGTNTWILDGGLRVLNNGGIASFSSQAANRQYKVRVFGVGKFYTMGWDN